MRQVNRPVNSPEVLKAICQAVALGETKEHAANFAGVSRPKIARWYKLGQEEFERLEEGGTPNPEKERFVEVYLEISAAESSFILSNLMKIKQATDSGDWRAAIKILGNRYPEEYGNQVTHHGGGGTPIQIAIVSNEDERFGKPIGYAGYQAGIGKFISRDDASAPEDVS